jgi:hypothetical protein
MLERLYQESEYNWVICADSSKPTGRILGQIICDTPSYIGDGLTCWRFELICVSASARTERTG